MANPEMDAPRITIVRAMTLEGEDMKNRAIKRFRDGFFDKCKVINEKQEVEANSDSEIRLA